MLHHTVRSLNWSSLESRRAKARLSTVYKFHHGLITVDTKYRPPQFPHAEAPGCLIHWLFNPIPSCRTDYRISSFFPTTTVDWNNLLEDVATAPILDLFKSRLSSTTKTETFPLSPFSPHSDRHFKTMKVVT